MIDKCLSLPIFIEEKLDKSKKSLQESMKYLN